MLLLLSNAWYLAMKPLALITPIFLTVGFFYNVKKHSIYCIFQMRNKFVSSLSDVRNSTMLPVYALPSYFIILSHLLSSSLQRDCVSKWLGFDKFIFIFNKSAARNKLLSWIVGCRLFLIYNTFNINQSLVILIQWNCYRFIVRHFTL